MAWTDPKNQNFFTTGWKMFTLGFILVLGSSILFAANMANLVISAVDLVGLLLILAAIFVWMAKALENSKK